MFLYTFSGETDPDPDPDAVDVGSQKRDGMKRTERVSQNLRIE